MTDNWIVAHTADVHMLLAIDSFMHMLDNKAKKAIRPSKLR